MAQLKTKTETKPISENSPKPSSDNKLLMLELVRFFAATFVVIDHLTQRFTADPNRFVRVIQWGGQLPLMTFFVLSGFVIGLRHVNRSESFASYARSRFIRIFPVYLFSLFAAAGVVWLALQIKDARNSPDLFWAKQVHDIVTTGGIKTLLGNVLMLQGPKWFPNHGCFWPYGATSPLWSLSFEWWFYMAFWPLKSKLNLKTARNLVYGCALVGTVGLCIYPCQPFVWLTAFAVWWAGVELAVQYQKEKKLTLSAQIPTACVLAGQFLILTVAGYVLRRWTFNNFHSILNVYNWIICALLVFAAALIFSKSFERPFPKTNKLVRRLGADSYAVYAIHYVLFNLVAITAREGSLMWFGVATVGVYVLADLMEHYVHPFGSRLVKSVWKSA